MGIILFMNVEEVSMQKGGMLFVIAPIVAGLLIAAGLTAPAAPKEETVTLAISGMT